MSVSHHASSLTAEHVVAANHAGFERLEKGPEIGETGSYDAQIHSDCGRHGDRVHVKTWVGGRACADSKDGESDGGSDNTS